LTSLANKFSHPPPLLFEVIEAFVPYFGHRLNIAETLVSDFAPLFISLMQKPGFAQLAEGRFLMAMVAICDICLQADSLAGAKPFALLLCAALVQSCSPGVEFLIDRALPFLHGQAHPLLFDPAFMVVSSLLMANPDALLPSLTPDFLQLGFQRLKDFTLLPLNFFQVCFAGLCVLAKYGSAEAFEALVSLLPVIVQKRLAELTSEGSDEESLAASRNELRLDPELDILLCQLPSDSWNVDEIFLEVARSTGGLSLLDADTQAFIAEHFIHSDSGDGSPP
jgi:hypothetical protein